MACAVLEHYLISLLQLVEVVEDHTTPGSPIAHAMSRQVDVPLSTLGPRQGGLLDVGTGELSRTRERCKYPSSVWLGPLWPLETARSDDLCWRSLALLGWAWPSRYLPPLAEVSLVVVSGAVVVGVPALRVFVGSPVEAFRNESSSGRVQMQRPPAP